MIKLFYGDEHFHHISFWLSLQYQELLTDLPLVNYVTRVQMELEIVG
ncbi:hypothetical protein [Carnobacterium gallinarum]|nr:hypothetical protein [Carnobacterium gallinarum]